MKKTSRLKYEKPNYFSTKVLMGNWYEETVGNFQKTEFEHNTVYRNDYKSKSPVDKESTDKARNLTQIKSEFTDNIFLSKNSDAYPNFYDNYSTTYDLAHKYFPEWMDHASINRIMRFRLLRYEPTDEYLNSFGNLSLRRDLMEYKKQKWKCDIVDGRLSNLTSNRSDFVEYDKESYKMHRWLKPRPINVKSNKVLLSTVCYPKTNSPQLQSSVVIR